MEVTPTAEAPLFGEDVVGATLPSASVLDGPSTPPSVVGERGAPAGAISSSSMSSSSELSPESGKGVLGLGAKRGFWLSVSAGDLEEVETGGDEAEAMATTATRTRVRTKSGRRLAMRTVVINFMNKED